MFNIKLQDLLTLQPKTELIRNICIIAHVDHGKTTLSDCLIASNGIISTKNAGLIRYLDYTPEEQERGITMKASAIALLFETSISPNFRLRNPLPCTSSQHPTHTNENSTPSDSSASLSLSHQSTPLQVCETNNNTKKYEEQSTPISSSTSSLSSSGQSSGERTYLINLLDSPGHVDFTSEVCSALRVSDGAILVVDVIEGVCIQTRAVLRAAWRERLKVVLVLNKIDKLIDTLQLDPLAAWLHLRKVLESVNQLASSLQDEEEFRSLEFGNNNNNNSVSQQQKQQQDDNEEILQDNGPSPPPPPLAGSSQGLDSESDTYFSPKRGNVVFASAIHGWGFRLNHFVDIYAKRLGVRPGLLLQTLWGDYYLNPKTRKVHTKPPSPNAVPMFVQFVLKNIWDIYTAVNTRDQTKLEKIVTTLSLSISSRDLKSDDNRTLLQSILGRWLPLSRAVLEMVIEQIPDPRTAQQCRVPQLWTPPRFEMTSEQRAVMKRLKVGMLRCDPHAEVVAFVSKVFAVSNDNLLESSTARKRTSKTGEHTLIALARLFSGTLRFGDTVHVLGPKYSPATPHLYRTQLTLHDLYLIMGRVLMRIDSVLPGNVFGIALPDIGTSTPSTTSLPPPLHHLPQPLSPQQQQQQSESQQPVIIKTATLSSTPLCASFDAMRLETAPIIRVAVEPESASDYSALARGMRLLHLADPGVHTYVDTTGEFIVCALGEVHLQHCLKELREKYANVPLRVSPPLVSFRETITDAPSRVLSQRLTSTETERLSSTWSVSDGDGDDNLLSKEHNHNSTTIKEENEDENDERVARSSERRDDGEGRVRESSSSRERHSDTSSTGGGRGGDDNSSVRSSSTKDKDKNLPSLTSNVSKKKKKTALRDRSLPKEPREKKIDFVVHVSTANKRLTVSVQCRPLPPTITSFLEVNSERIRRLVERHHLLFTTPTSASSSSSSSDSFLKCDKVTRHFCEELKDVFIKAGTEWEKEFNFVWAFGPHQVGSNVLLNHIPGFNTSFWWRSLTSIEITEKEKTLLPQNETSTSETCDCLFRRLRELNQSLVNGFQLATQAGPLCEEPMMGVCFMIENVILQDYHDCHHHRHSQNTSLSSSTTSHLTLAPRHEQVMNISHSTTADLPSETSPPVHLLDDEWQNTSLFKGQVISAVKEACRQAVTRRSQRLMEAYYLCDIVLDGSDAYGKAHAVLAKRRAQILSDEVRQGTYMYNLRAYLPAVESFGFAEELFSKTSGACQTQMMFSHWALLDEDPDFVPLSEEEVAEMGDLQNQPPNLARRYVDAIRKRKGLPVKEKLVEGANKQRNLSKNK